MSRSSKLTMLKPWLENNKDWLTESPSPYPTTDLWCKLCKIAIKPKKYNVELHALTKKHRNKIESQSIDSTVASLTDDDKTTIEEQVIAGFHEQQIISGMHEGRPIKRIIMHTVPNNNMSNFKLLDIQKDHNNSNRKTFIVKRSLAPYPDANALVDDVCRIFKRDVKEFLQNNENILKSFSDNPHFFKGEDGLSRLTKMLVGHMSQHYLIEYTQESYKNSGLPLKKKSVAEKLQAIEQIIEKSVVEMQNVKAELQNGRAQGDASITLESINIEVEPRKDMLNEDDDDEDDQYQDKKPPIGRIE